MEKFRYSKMMMSIHSDTAASSGYLHGIVGRHAWVPGNMTWVAKAGVHGHSLAIHVRPVGIYWAAELTREQRKIHSQRLISTFWTEITQ